MATSNSLKSGTSIAAMAKPNAPKITSVGTNGSADSGEPGLATSTVITVYSTASGQNQLAHVKAPVGRSPLSTHHSPPTPAIRKKTKLPHWYSNWRLIRISAMHTSVPAVRKKIVLCVWMIATWLFVVRSATWIPSIAANASSTTVVSRSEEHTSELQS